MSNFETALHLLPSFLVVVRKFQILTSTPFFRAVWKETSFVASRGRAGGDEEERRGGGGHGGVKERYERVERKEEEEVEVEEEEEEVEKVDIHMTLQFKFAYSL